MLEEIVTPNQVATYGKVPYQRVLRDIKDGTLAAMQMGGAYAIRRADALEYLATGGEEISDETVAILERRLAVIKERLAAKKRAQQLRGQYD